MSQKTKILKEIRRQRRKVVEDIVREKQKILHEVVVEIFMLPFWKRMRFAWRIITRTK